MDFVAYTLAFLNKITFIAANIKMVAWLQRNCKVRVFTPEESVTMLYNQNKIKEKLGYGKKLAIKVHDIIKIFSIHLTMFSVPSQLGRKLKLIAEQKRLKTKQ